MKYNIIRQPRFTIKYAIKKTPIIFNSAEIGTILEVCYFEQIIEPHIAPEVSYSIAFRDYLRKFRKQDTSFISSVDKMYISKNFCFKFYQTDQSLKILHLSGYMDYLLPSSFPTTSFPSYHFQFTEKDFLFLLYVHQNFNCSQVVDSLVKNLFEKYMEKFDYTFKDFLTKACSISYLLDTVPSIFIKKYFKYLLKNPYLSGDWLNKIASEILSI